MSGNSKPTQNAALSFELGQRVRMTGTVEKVHSGPGGGYTKFLESRLPVRHTHSGPQIALTSGIVIGARTVQPGRTHWSYDGAVFMPDIGKARRVWLVAFDLRRKPVMCFDHQLEAEADDE